VKSKDLFSKIKNIYFQNDKAKDPVFYYQKVSYL